MPCFSPLQAFYVEDGSGKKLIRFSQAYACMFERGEDISQLENHIALPCGRCIGCRLERSRQWAVRIMHEASLNDDNCFITLTYDDVHLPSDGSLRKRDFQLFMKRFRQECGERIRYFHCGEYGEDFSRPHYHACIFGFDFKDKVFYKKTNCGDNLFTSYQLERIWGKGFCPIGSLTFESAAYVARYCTKKVNGPLAEEHYKGLQPEYATMSRRPGIGKGWYDKFAKTDCWSGDFVLARGVKCKPPRFYDSQLEKASKMAFDKIKENRSVKALGRSSDNSYRRLKDREQCKIAQVSRLVRGMESNRD